MIKPIVSECVKSKQLEEENICRPWLIVRLLDSSRPYIVARFANRQDAEDHLRFLRRFIPHSIFQMMFESPN